MVLYEELVHLSAKPFRLNTNTAATPVRRIGKLSTIIDVPLKLDDAQKQKLINAALTCPVHHSLHPDIEKPIEWRWKA